MWLCHISGRLPILNRRAFYERLLLLLKVYLVSFFVAYRLASVAPCLVPTYGIQRLAQVTNLYSSFIAP